MASNSSWFPFLIDLNNSMTNNPTGKNLDPISDQEFWIYRKICMAIWIAISGFGVVTNVFNIATFIKMGLSDSITISFFALAVSDFNACILDCGITWSVLVDFVAKEWNLWLYITPMVTTVYITFFRRIFSHISIAVIVFLAFQRCLCVVWPFEVKGLFNRTRTLVYIAITTAFPLISRCLFLSRLHVTSMTNPITNVTFLVTYFIPGSDFYIYFNTAILNTVFGIASPVLITLCLILMGLALRRSKRFKQSIHNPESMSKSHQKPTVDNNGRQEKKKARSKEDQVLMQVTLVAVIFVLTNIPMLCTALAAMFVPEFGHKRTYHNLYHTMGSLGVTGEAINASSNFIIYYNFNSKFRMYFTKRNVKETK